jgi:hypothetical protein
MQTKTNSIASVLNTLRGLRTDVDAKVASVNTVTPAAGGNVTLTTDNVQESATPTNQWFSMSRVRATVLTGLGVGANAVIAATDTLPAAFAKLQAQVSANATALGGKLDSTLKDAQNGVAGLTNYALNLKDATGAFLSKVVNAATAARTWTLPDKDGTFAMLSDVQSGALVPLGSYNISSAVSNIDFLTIFTAQCNEVVIVGEGLQSTTASGTITMQVAIGGAVQTGVNYFIGAGEAATLAAGAQFALHPSTMAANGSLSLKISLLNVNDTSSVREKTIFVAGSQLDNSSTRKAILRGGQYAGVAGALSGFRILSSAPLTAGTFRVYGIKNS